MPEHGLAERVRLGAARHPGRTALRIGTEAWTYERLHDSALRIASALDGPDGTPPVRVGVLAGATSTAYVGILAALYAGAAAVPLNLGFPAPRTVDMVRAAGLTVVVADERGARVLSGLAAELPGVRCVVTGPEHPAQALRPGPGGPLAEPRPGAGDDLAYVMFTSGSTGRPKGVPISHGNVAHFLDAAQARHRVTADDVLAQTFEPTFDLFMFALFMGWSAGAEVVAVPPRVLGRLPDFVARHGLTLWFSVPAAIRVVRRTGGLTAGTMRGLTRSLFCGEGLPARDAADWQAATGGTVDNLYGPTELTIACTAHRWSPDDATVNGLVPIGQPYDGLRYTLVDTDGHPGGDEGELCVTGPQMFRGYLDPADDAGRFLDSAAARWYRTGDRVRRLPGGELAYLGRLDHQVKIRGYRVELLEVEHELRGLDGVTDCAVVPVPDGDETALAAAYTGDPDVGAGLARALARRLPAYLVPASIRHVEALPRNANGKVDRPRIVAARNEVEGS